MVNVMKGVGVHPPPSPAWPNFTLMTKCTPESRRYYSVYSVAQTVSFDKFFGPYDIEICVTKIFAPNSVGHEIFVSWTSVALGEFSQYLVDLLYQGLMV